jgi:hypothetical protein
MRFLSLIASLCRLWCKQLGDQGSWQDAPVRFGRLGIATRYDMRYPEKSPNVPYSHSLLHRSQPKRDAGTSEPDEVESSSLPSIGFLSAGI